MLSKVFELIGKAVCFVGVVILLSWGLGKGCDGEMLVECYEFKEWQEQGHPNEIPDYCYDLGLPRE